MIFCCLSNIILLHINAACWNEFVLDGDDSRVKMTIFIHQAHAVEPNCIRLGWSFLGSRGWMKVRHFLRGDEWILSGSQGMLKENFRKYWGRLRRVTCCGLRVRGCSGKVEGWSGERLRRVAGCGLRVAGYELRERRGDARDRRAEALPMSRLLRSTQTVKWQTQKRASWQLFSTNAMLVTSYSFPATADSVGFYQSVNWTRGLLIGLG